MQTRDLAQLILAGLPWQPALSPLPEYFAVPAEQPRWLVPNCGKLIAPALASWSPYRLSSCLNWKLCRVASWLGALDALPGTQPIRMDNAEQINWPSLGWRGSKPPIPLIYLGTPGLGRKAVIHLVDADGGNCQAIVKVPIGPQAKSAIVREANVLTTLDEEMYPFSPRLLHLDSERGIATQQFLAGNSGSRRLRPEYLELLRSLVLRDEYTTIGQHLAGWRELLLAASAHKVDFDLVESALESCCDEHPLPSCRIHGDFAPWNIRRRAHGAAALIDWEESRADGLPLNDAFHFLHIQDFVFNQQPSAHVKHLLPFAKSLGIPPQQCRKLEIAYLVDAYVTCALRVDQQQRAEFLRRTLALTTRGHSTVAASSAVSSPRLRLVSSRPANTAREELFDAMIGQLKQAAIPYCVLSGHESDPQANSPDVDIMFRSRDLHRLPDLLAATAQSSGAQLVQAIQHETTACYFVLARQDGKHVTHLDADCYSDYRRDRRMWLTAEDVIANRRRHRDFYLPSVVDEFTYYLIKKVLKQSINTYQLKRLQHLFAHNPAECRKRIAKLWSADTALLLERAIVEQKLSWLQTYAAKLAAELRRPPALEHWVWRCTQFMRELKRFVKRITSPTGLSVVIVGADSVLRSEIADGVLCGLAPAFRRTRRFWDPSNVRRRVFQLFEIWSVRIRSTLVVRAADESGARTRLPRILRKFVATCLQPLAPCDLLIDLRSGQINDSEHARSRSSNVLYINADEPAEYILQAAQRAILDLLAARTAHRLQLRADTHDAAIVAQSQQAELRSQGLD